MLTCRAGHLVSCGHIKASTLLSEVSHVHESIRAVICCPKRVWSACRSWVSAFCRTCTGSGRPFRMRATRCMAPTTTSPERGESSPACRGASPPTSSSCWASSCSSSCPSFLLCITNISRSSCQCQPQDLVVVGTCSVDVRNALYLQLYMYIWIRTACDWIAFKEVLFRSDTTVSFYSHIEGNNYDEEPTKYCLTDMHVSIGQGRRPIDCSGI